MYIWIGCKLPEAFEKQIRAKCLPLSAGLDTSGFSLPQHISLKISFQAGERYEEILSYLEERLRKEKQFYVNPKKPELQGNIIWIPFRENATLRHLHNGLDRELKIQYGIPQHLFDKAFLFHSTLLMGPQDRLQLVLEQLQDIPMPEELPVDTLLLGISETGKSGAFRVVRQIHL